MQRFAILTSGGDAPGMNAAIAAAADRVEALGGEAIGVSRGFAGLVQRQAAPIAGRAAAHALEAGTWLQTSRWAQLREPEGVQRCREALAELEVDGLVVLGGNGSAAAARAVAGERPVAFVPATIDGDVSGTEVSIGMDSAIAYGVDVIERLLVTGRSLPGRAFLVQTLGAPGGTLADAVAAATGIQDALVPERPAHLDELARRLGEQAETGAAVAVMSEAVGDAVAIAAQLAPRAGVRVHPTILGHAQRAATPSAFDRSLATAAGALAVGELAAGRSAFVTLTAGGQARAVGLGAT